MYRLHRTVNGLLATAVVVVTLQPAPNAHADVQPGDVITEKNVGQAEDLISPAVKWMVNRGMRMQIGPYRPIEMPPAYVAATKEYGAAVTLSEDKRRVDNWVAGQPFANLDPNDPDVAIKIMYNFASRWWETDDVDVRNLDADTGPIGHDDEGLIVEKHFVIDHFRRMYFTGRLVNEPKPAYEPNNDSVRYKEALRPLIEPFDLKGVGFTYFRYLDENRQDDSWLYLPQLRRVRRLSSAQRSDALFGQDTDQDSYGGYAGNIAWMNWRFLGKKTMLACVHGEHFPVNWGKGGGDFSFDDVWEKRPVYVVEGQSTLAQYAYGKRVIFVDREGFFIPYSDIYDKAGQLWKIWLNDYKFAREPYPGAPAEGQYASKMPFLPGIVMVDIQRDHATRAALPSRSVDPGGGWRFNQGVEAGVTEDFFSVAELIKAGR
jgi:hypothetical protein